ncbi:MAG: MFS transporter, partial [Firmicutes bacterium]|nr:MFS transporter [Bacillota bacterium]
MNKPLKKITSISLISQYMGLPKQVYLLTISRLICATGYFVYPFVTLYLSTAEGYGESTIGWFTFMFSMICLPSSVIAGKLADKFSRKRTYLIYMLLTDLFFIVTGI